MPTDEDLPLDDGFNIAEVKVTLLQHLGHVPLNLQFCSLFFKSYGHRRWQIMLVFTNPKVEKNMPRRITLLEKGIGT